MVRMGSTERRTPADTADWVRCLMEKHPPSKAADIPLPERIDQMERLLALKVRARILDLGCGSGRQTIELARRGYRVLGMDSSAAILSPARAAARGQKLNVHFLAGDMRRIPYSGEFDAVVNFQRPIGCYPTRRDDLNCLRSIAKSLKPQGRLLLDLINREWLVRRLRSGHGSDAQAFDLATGRLDCMAFGSVRRGRSPVVAGSLRIYSLTEILQLFDQAGLVLLKISGDFEGTPYELDSLRMVVLAEKGPGTPGQHTDDLPRALRIKGRPH